VTPDGIGLPVLWLPVLSPASLGNYLASPLGLLLVLSRKWPSWRIACCDDVLRLICGSALIEQRGFPLAGKRFVGRRGPTESAHSPGAHCHYTARPARPAARERGRIPARTPECHLMQFALGWNVAPDPSAIVRLTSRFRGAVVRELLRLKTSGASTSWSRATKEVRAAVADMTGKDAESQPLKGHRHTEFLTWCESGRPTRLLVWRGARAFDDDEQEAILLAAARDVSWARAGADVDEWRVRLIPLDTDVPAPPGFDRSAALAWESVTPYVPPRHRLRGGKERPSESLASQITRELLGRGFSDRVAVEVGESAGWVSVHLPWRSARQRAHVGNRRGYAVRLQFVTPVVGPIRLGHSSSFGLGLFRPVIG
jgi:hypothetical protein